MMRHGFLPVLLGALLLAGVSSLGLSATSGDASNGKELYRRFCAECHGSSGKGDGPLAVKRGLKPRDHTDAGYMEQLNDQDLYKIIREGGAAVGKSKDMPPSRRLREEDIRDLIAYVRSLAGSGPRR